jgi:hypothetical protein
MIPRLVRGKQGETGLDLENIKNPARETIIHKP